MTAIDVETEAAEHTQVWFGAPERPLFGWLSRPARGLARGGVVLCSPLGEEGRAAHRTFRRLAETLAEAGLVALRFDYDGQGDSAGVLDDPDRVGAWLRSIAAARAYLVDLGVPVVSCVGMRLGATLAACQAAVGDGGVPAGPAGGCARAAGPFASLVLWDPCQSGRSFLREGEALYGFGEDRLEGPDDGLRHTPGFQYDAATAAALRRVDLSKIPADRRLADRVLLLTRTDRPRAVGIDQRLTVEGDRLQTGPATAQDQLLDLPPSDCHVPETALREVVAWLCAGVADQERVPVKAPDAEHAVLLGSATRDTEPVRERLVRLGPDGIVGLVDEPLDLDRRTAAAGPQPWVVLVNVAAEHHIGPGRRWVEWARQWAAAGYRVIRIDQSGVGDSPTRPGQLENAPFAPEWIDDMRHVVQELRSDGAKVGMVGLCSGSYSAFEAAMWDDVDAIFAINPRLTLWPAAKGSGVYTDRRRAAMVPNKPFADLAARRRITAGGLWRIYREVAVWHAPLLVLWRVWRRRTAIKVIACHDDAQHFTEVYALLPIFWWMSRSPRFEFLADDVVDHSLLARRSQLVAYDLATEFLRKHLQPHRKAPRRRTAALNAAPPPETAPLPAHRLTVKGRS